VKILRQSSTDYQFNNNAHYFCVIILRLNLISFAYLTSNMRTRIKYCGFTRVDDVLDASVLGVDAIGLVFYEPSPRHVSIEQAISIVRSIPAFVCVVALFVDAEPGYIDHVLNKVSVDCLQFHGDEPAEYCRSFNKRYIKAIRMKQDMDFAEIASTYNDADGILLDAYHPDVKGGSGQSFDWGLIPQNCKIPIILAGGLDEFNVAQAVASVKPYAVDVSSGIEMQKGMKDKNKMAAFVRAVWHGDRAVE
jgi:phosphoribosylanthranilate isomerase